MTDHERRLVLRGMSIARGLLRNTQCTHVDAGAAHQRDYRSDDASEPADLWWHQRLQS